MPHTLQSAWQRPLGDMLGEMFDAVLAARHPSAVVRPTSLDLDLPIEMRLVESAGEPVLVADVPAWRWRTDFDRRPGRLRISWGVTVS